MSVVFRNPNGWLLDSCAFIDQGLQRCLPEGKANLGLGDYFKSCFKSQCFQILKTHIAVKPTVNPHCDSVISEEAVPERKENDTLIDCVPAKKRNRKRKRHELNQGEIDSVAYHEKIRAVIAEGTKSLVDAGLSCGYLSGVTGVQQQQPLPSQECNLAALCDMAKELPLVADTDSDQEPPVQYIDTEDGSNTAHLDLFTRITENCNIDCAKEVTLMGEKYIIPPRSSFLLSDLTRMQPLVDYGKRFDLIVLDPPWENKSVKRSGRYSYLPSSQLRRLPVPLLASPGCVVVTWVTNKPSHLRFVREELFPHWGVEVLAEWFWVKVTRSGEFVFPLDSPHKKPYEVLVLGRYHGENSPSSPGKVDVHVEDKRVITSIPSVLHSHKPSLSEVLEPYVGPEARCLELFARSLQPGWTSWGNEVLKFQHVSYYTVH